MMRRWREANRVRELTALQRERAAESDSANVSHDKIRESRSREEIGVQTARRRRRRDEEFESFGLGSVWIANGGALIVRH
jgi:hypothetical protein